MDSAYASVPLRGSGLNAGTCQELAEQMRRNQGGYHALSCPSSEDIVDVRIAQTKQVTEIRLIHTHDEDRNYDGFEADLPSN